MRQQYLIGKRIFLSPVEDADSHAICIIKSSGCSRRFMSSTLPKTDEDVLDEIKRLRASGSAYFVICEKDDEEQKVIGFVILEMLSNIIRAAEIHICISEAYIGNGYGQDVVSLITNYALQELNIHSIRALIRENNESSLNCFKKCGYRLVGTLPEWSFYDGEYHDCFILDCIPRFLLGE